MNTIDFTGRVEDEASQWVARAARASCEAGQLALATDPLASILHRHSDAL